jgi:hypothetical protein
MPSRTEVKPFAVHYNLYLALKNLQPDIGKNPIVLWVDYICIKQEGLDADREKKTQIPRMTEIYNSAFSVIIWLGPECDRNDEAMDFITEIVNLQSLEIHSNSHQSVQKWAAFTNLMKFHWFSRWWVVQEVALARVVFVMCGSKTVQWDDFSTAVSLFTDRLENIKTLFTNPATTGTAGFLLDVEGLGAVVLVKALNDLARKNIRGEVTQLLLTLEALVSSLLSFDVARPHEAIFSLLSLASDTGLSDTKSKKGKSITKPTFDIEVDYNRDVIELFAKFTQTCIQTSKSLDMICRHWAPAVEDKNPPPWILKISSHLWHARNRFTRTPKRRQLCRGSIQQGTENI